jgi:hypothetical protein
MGLWLELWGGVDVGSSSPSWFAMLQAEQSPFCVLLTVHRFHSFAKIVPCRTFVTRQCCYFFFQSSLFFRYTRKRKRCSSSLDVLIHHDSCVRQGWALGLRSGYLVKFRTWIKGQSDRWTESWSDHLMTDWGSMTRLKYGFFTELPLVQIKKTICSIC